MTNEEKIEQIKALLEAANESKGTDIFIDDLKIDKDVPLNPDSWKKMSSILTTLMDKQ